MNFVMAKKVRGVKPFRKLAKNKASATLTGSIDSDDPELVVGLLVEIERGEGGVLYVIVVALDPYGAAHVATLDYVAGHATTCTMKNSY